MVFCPSGRSTTILTTMKTQLHELQDTGHVTPELLADTMNATLIKLQSWSGRVSGPGRLWLMVFVLVNVVIGYLL